MKIETFNYGLKSLKLEDNIGQLSTDELVSFHSLINPTAKLQFLERHLQLHISINSFLQSNKHIEIKKHVLGYWFIPQFPNLTISSSSSNEKYIICISYSKIGIDIEFIQDIPNMNSIVSMFFHSNEITYYNNLSPTEKLISFYKIWTAKEAFIKLLGFKEINLIKIPISEQMHSSNENIVYEWQILESNYIVCKASIV